MEWFYIFSLCPIIIGFILSIYNKNISWKEWIIGSIVALICACIMHIITTFSIESDTETWSGRIVQARQFSRWKEYYEYAVYRTKYYFDSKGNMHSYQVFDHWQPTSQWHDEYWKCYSDINTSYDISKKDFEHYVQVFNDKTSVAGCRDTGRHRSHIIAGDPNDYVANNKTGWIQPVTKQVTFENRIKASKTVFSFVDVPPTISVFKYPQNHNPFSSDRVLGTAKASINTFEWDKMNARLGKTKKVNVIIIGFDSEDNSLGDYQQAKFINGKKNDVVLCYGKGWSKVFGWTDSEICKRNLESILLNNKIDDSIIPLTEQEINNNYLIKNWHDFDYIKAHPKTIHYVIFFIVLFVTQTGLYIFFHKNDIDELIRGY